MTSRPRRSAAAKATENISVQSKWADSNERSGDSPVPSRRSGRSVAYRDAPSSPESGGMPSRSRQPTRGSRRSEQFDGGEIVQGKRNRGTKKSYVVDSSPDEDEDEIEDEVEVELDEDDAMDEDAEGEEEIDIDAEGEDLDADGDVDMDIPAPRRSKVTSIKVSRSAKPRTAARAAASRIVADDDDDDDDDDDELSEPDSDLGDETMGAGDETMADEDAEGEEIEVAGDGDEDDEEDEEEEDEEQDDEEDGDDGEVGAAGPELDSDEDGSRAGTPDLAKMTKRQRARFDEQPQEYMKLSDEVQAKKVFTAEELSMRRQEMARRRRNLSEKRNEEVKMETINKLLKKQAPKTSKKRGGSVDADAGPPSTLIRWVSNKSGSKVSVPSEVMGGPVGEVFGPPAKGNNSLTGSKLVQEVA